VLETAYGYSRKKTALVLENILRTRQFRFKNKDLLWASLDDYRNRKGDFADFLLGRAGRKPCCCETFTFDSGL